MTGRLGGAPRPSASRAAARPPQRFVQSIEGHTQLSRAL